MSKIYAIDVKQESAHSDHTGQTVKINEWRRGVVTIKANRQKSAIKQAERLFGGKQIMARLICGKFRA